MVQDGDFRLNPDAYGRVHTIFTRLPRELRDCLQLRGEPIVGIDLANAQPLLAGGVSRAYGASQSVRHGILNKEFYNGRYCDATLAQLERTYGWQLPQSPALQGLGADMSTVLEKREDALHLLVPVGTRLLVLPSSRLLVLSLCCAC